MIRFFFSLMSLLLASVGCKTDDTNNPVTLNSVEIVIADMQGTHEGKPAGVPENFDWAKGPRLGMGNNPGNFEAIIAWGQLYEEAGGNLATNTRVEIRNIKLYILSKKDKQWKLLQQSKKVDGAAYREDFAGDVSKPADPRQEPEGTISVKAGDGYNFHFWTATGRSTIDPADVAGVFSTVQARLITDDATKPDDRPQARYLLSMGADYWKSLDAQWDNFKTNGDVAIGKFKHVTSDWKAFNMTSLSAQEIRQNPPPLE